MDELVVQMGHSKWVVPWVVQIQIDISKGMAERSSGSLADTPNLAFIQLNCNLDMWLRSGRIPSTEMTGHWIKILKFYTWLANCHFGKYFLEDHELSKSSIEHIKLQIFGLKLCHTTGSYVTGSYVTVTIEDRDWPVNYLWPNRI